MQFNSKYIDNEILVKIQFSAKANKNSFVLCVFSAVILEKSGIVKDIVIGLYPRPFGNDFVLISLGELLQDFAGQKYRAVIHKCRDLYQKKNFEEYALLKKNLPGITFSGVFHPSRRSDQLASYTGLIIFDIDNLGTDKVVNLKSQLEKDPYVISAWLSPSGAGLKFLIYTSLNRELHKPVFNAALKYFEEEYGVEVDNSGADISRLCFASYDPAIRVKEDVKPFTEYLVADAEKVPAKPGTPNSTKTATSSIPKNSPRDKEALKKIIRFLKKGNLSITESYGDWIRVAYAIMNTFEYKTGRKLFLELCRLDKEAHDEEMSEKLIFNCYQQGESRSSFGTIIYFAKMKGYVPRFTRSRLKKRKK